MVLIVTVLASRVFKRKLSFPSPGNLPHSGIEPVSLALAGRIFTTEAPIPLTKYLKENVEENSLLPFCKSLHAILKNLGINELPLIQAIYHLSALNEQKPLFDVSYSDSAS